VFQLEDLLTLTVAVHGDRLPLAVNPDSTTGITPAARFQALFCSLFVEFELCPSFSPVRFEGGHGDVEMSLFSEAGFPLSSRPHVSLLGWN
jgi:hypothetical protein